MYRQENALDTMWWYAFLKTFALSWLVASMLSLGLGLPVCQRLRDHRNCLLLLLYTAWHGEDGFTEVFGLFFCFYSFSCIQYERAVPVVLWIVCAFLVCSSRAGEILALVVPCSTSQSRLEWW